jgi:type I restriction enzyme S subunit
MSCIGRFGIASVLTQDAVVNQQLHAFVVPDCLVAEYLVFTITSQAQFLQELATSTTVAYLNKENCNSLPIALPPLPEQNEIVRRVEALFRLADAIEKRVATATARAEKLTQAIPAKAFRGELVPTEAELARAEGRDYEPASVLLERIRAERTNAGITKTRKPRRERAKGR